MKATNSIQTNNYGTFENRVEALEWTVQIQNEKIMELYKQINSLKSSDQHNLEKEAQSKMVQLSLEENKENTNVENKMKKKRKKKTIKNEENIIEEVACVKSADPGDSEWLLNNLYHKKQDQNKDKREDEEEETTHSPINDDIFILKDNDMGPFFTPLVKQYVEMATKNIDETTRNRIVINKFKKAAENRRLNDYEVNLAQEYLMKFFHSINLIFSSKPTIRSMDKENKSSGPTPRKILQDVSKVMGCNETLPDEIQHMLEEYIVDKMKKDPFPRIVLSNIVRNKFEAYTKKTRANSVEANRLLVSITSYMDNIDVYIEYRNKTGLIFEL